MQVAKLAVHPDDADILLNERNNLDEQIIDKYRAAGRIAQTTLKYLIQLINDSYHLKKTARPYSSEELCLLGDSMIATLLGTEYTDPDQVREKGISCPVSIEINEYVSNVSPELGHENQTFFQEGDIVTISLGAQIDGYTSLVSHTMVIYPPGVLIGNELKPAGPLLGSKADALVACNIATNALIALLGLSVHPEKIAWIPELQNTGPAITGSIIRQLVDEIAESFGCTVVPGSKVRRIRRFLSGQAEGVVAERDFKGVVWDESNQEENLLKKSQGTDLIVHDRNTTASTNVSSAIPTDEFIVEAGEVYNIDLKFCGVSEFQEKGLITLQDSNDIEPTIYVRDVAMTHQLGLNSSRSLLKFVDDHCLVYPFKLSHAAESFPIDYQSGDIQAQLATIRKEVLRHRLGLKELTNRHLTVAKPVQFVKHVPFSRIIDAPNPTGRRGIDSSKLALPGKEVPLPALGVSALKLKSLLKLGTPASSVARESTTVLLDKDNREIIRLTGGQSTARPSWVHSQYKISAKCSDLITALSNLTSDKDFNLREVQPSELNRSDLHLEETMQID